MGQPPQVTANEASILLTSTDRDDNSASPAILLDVREQHEWDRGHSPLAVLIPMSQLQARIAEVPEDRTLLVICHSGQRSARVASALAEAGYDARSVAGGMIAWDAMGGELAAKGDRAPSVE